MKILLISHTCQSRTEGQPKAHCLARLPDVDLHVLIPDRWFVYGEWKYAETPEPPDFRCTISHIRWPWIPKAQVYLHWYPQLKKILRQFQPDIIDVWEEPWGLVSAHVAYVRNRHFPHIRFISETEQNTDKELPFPFENFRHYAIRRADFVVGRNQESIDILRTKGYRGPARVVPNAVDADLFHPLPPAIRDAARRALNIPGFLVGYVGRIIPGKGLMDLVEALPHCPSDVNAVLIGSGPYKDALFARAAELNCASRLHILSARPLEELPSLMNALHVLVLPSRTTPSWKEQFGRVIIEAQACQVPVIGSNSGAIPEVVGDVGLIFPEQDPRALAHAITQLHSDPQLCRQFAEQGRARVEAHFTWQRVAEKMHAIYQEVLALKPAHSPEPVPV